MTSNTTQLNTYNTALSANTVMPHIFGFLCLCIPLFSINIPNAFYYSCIALLLVSSGYLVTLRPSLNLKNPERWLLIAFFAYPLWAGSDMLLRDTWSWNEFKEPSRFILVIPIFLAIRTVRFPLAYLFTGIVMGAVWAGLQGIYQGEHLNIYRVRGGASHVTAFGNISLLLGVMSLASITLFKQYKRPMIIVALTGLCFGIIASMMSGSKGGWISLPLVFWIAVDLLEKPTYIKRFGSTLVMLTIAAIAYLSSGLVQNRVDAVIPSLITYFTSGDIADGSVGPRLEMWSASWAIFTQHPIFGAGVGNYFAEKAALIEQGVIKANVATFVQSHNQLLQSMAEGGLIGVACVYGIYTALIALYRNVLTQNKPIAVCGLMLAVAFMDFGMADGIWSITNAGTFFTVMAVIFAGLSSQRLKIG
jgi:O-antigen ligase